MSERDFFPDDNPSPPPQPIPRAGLGIADQIGFSAHAANGHAADESTPEELPDVNEEAIDNASEVAVDPALVPELAPLATPSTMAEPLVSSQPLDEFDVEKIRNGYEPLQYSGGGGGGGDGGDELDSPGDEESSSPAQDLFSHLAELRQRILYSVVAVAVASAVTWNYGKWIQEFLARPIIGTLKSSGLPDAQLITLDPTEGFYLYFQITLAAAILIAAPFILFQMWRFIEPALTKTERRYSIVLIPFSIILFFSGVVLGYLISPMFFAFFLQFQPAESVANFSYGKSVALLAKMLLVFGVCFQVPVVTIFLNKIGLVSRNFLIEYWRHAVVIIFLIVAIITPTWDPLTLIACAGPPCFLYGLSIWLVKWL